MRRTVLWIVAGIVAGSIQTLTAADGIWNRVDNTDVVSPAAWSHAGNWVDGQIAGAGGHAYFTNAFPTKAYRAVEIPPEGVTLNRFWFKNHDGTAWDGAFLFVSGGPMRMEEVGGITPRLDSTSDQLHLYVPIHGTQGLDSNPSWSVNLFADNAYTGTTTLEGGYWITRFDGIAESSDPVLSDYAATNDYVLTGGRLTFYGRRSMGAAVTSQWALVEGSAVVTYVSGPNSGALTPGVAVAGDGIPAGTFVRRIIDTAHLQLSLPATATGAAVALSFSPLASSCYQMIQSIENLHGNGTIMVNKNGADLLRVDVGQLRGTANMLQRVSTGQTSGVLALHDARAYSGIFSLQDAWLELPMSGETHPVLSNVTVLTTSTLDVPDAGAVAEISTLAGNGARLVKQGAGRLSAGIGFESALDLEIAQGSVALPRPAAERLLSEAALWLDASRADTLTFDTEGRISRWADANGLAKGATNAVTARQPTRVENALNGLPVVDFGPYQTSGSGGGLFLETREAAVRSAFIVYDGRHTDAVMLGEASRDYSALHENLWVYSGGIGRSPKA